MIATTTQLLSSGEFCKLRYDTTPVKSASENASFYTSNSKVPNFERNICDDFYICRKEIYEQNPKPVLLKIFLFLWKMYGLELTCGFEL